MYSDSADADGDADADAYADVNANSFVIFLFEGIFVMFMVTSFYIANNDFCR